MNIAQVLEWKYGRVAGCNLDTGEITSWTHTTIPKPTPEQLALDAEEYQVYKTKETRNDSIKAQIALLDSKRVRSLAEGDTVYLANLNAQIVALRAQIKP